jgi:hypothetical protein
MSTDANNSERRSGAERRTARRLSAQELPELQARLVAGPDVKLLDVSRGGARFESDNRLLPGTTVGLRLVQGDAVFLAMARVVRSRVAGMLSGKIRYESAVAFDKDFPLLAVDDLALPAAVAEPAPSEGDAIVLPALDEDPAGVLPQGSELDELVAVPRAVPKRRPVTPLLTLTALVPAAMPDVRQLLAANRW